MPRPFAAGGCRNAVRRETLHVHFAPPGFIGVEGDPLAVGRKLAEGFICRSYEERNRLAPWSQKRFLAHGNYPQVLPLCRMMIVVDQEASRQRTSHLLANGAGQPELLLRAYQELKD
jgi:hypothetical protein